MRGIRRKNLGGQPAFPVGIGINEVAAHYTSPPGDSSKIPPASLVKVDFGVHVNGYLTDTSVTVMMDSRFEPLVRAADEALQNAIRTFRPGVKLSEIGRVVQSTINRFGLRPISNLTGHKIDRYTVHAGKSVPNVPQLDGGKIIEGEVFAIEPFVTTGDARGAVTNGGNAYIYRYLKKKGDIKDESRKVLDYIYSNFSTLPFAARWLLRTFGPENSLKALRDLEKNHCIISYPVLVEESGKPVAQAEQTVLVNHDGCTILTAG
jgi:methionyl aminopeptidase